MSLCAWHFKCLELDLQILKKLSRKVLSCNHNISFFQFEKDITGNDVLIVLTALLDDVQKCFKLEVKLPL